ncbi:uncharacterized protein BDZ99DRAFT_470718 [Mytilinidion resinicola]|uniref:Uncharacterized protein n=1 Tax=Mytilinidion resinicola TaxID=574789 RepID=A0A6A6ZAJ1_9PEZI|nr:uncharacterized protein BDZ99DRAFT_470718 [Mytilinidion resinicola]KAF2817753.1 hypothetical protein BDZ99DRAFT_470718 [Mytilinidion resinicola]
MHIKGPSWLGLRRGVGRPVEFHDEPKVATQKLGKSKSVTANITSLQQGTCQGGQPASLVTLGFAFANHITSVRFTKITVKVVFEAVTVPRDASTSTSTTTQGLLAAHQHPEVQHFCPGILDTSATTADITEETSINQYVKRTQYKKKHYSTIEGQKWMNKLSSSRDFGMAEGYNEVEWTLQENHLQQNGLQPQFKVACLLKHASARYPFRANITISAATNATLYKGASEQAYLSVLFRNSESDSPQDLRNFDDMSDKDWEGIVDYDHIYASFTAMQLVD